jgi:hypothetical protein
LSAVIATPRESIGGQIILKKKKNYMVVTLRDEMTGSLTAKTNDGKRIAQKFHVCAFATNFSSAVESIRP